MTKTTRAEITYYSDVLCVWAYVAERRLTELRAAHGDRIELSYRFVQIFGHTADKFATGWAKRGGVAGYREHMGSVTARFDHVQLQPDVWVRTIPTSSGPAHVFLKAVQLICAEELCDSTRQDRFDGRTLIEEAAWQVRLAFFAQARDVSSRSVLLSIADDLGLPQSEVVNRLDDGTAFAALCLDQTHKDRHQVAGSPTWVLNDGRQKLYGNVGYRIVEANVLELLNDDNDQASWC